MMVGHLGINSNWPRGDPRRRRTIRRYSGVFRYGPRRRVVCFAVHRVRVVHKSEAMLPSTVGRPGFHRARNDYVFLGHRHGRARLSTPLENDVPADPYLFRPRIMCSDHRAPALKFRVSGHTWTRVCPDRRQQIPVTWTKNGLQ